MKFAELKGILGYKHTHLHLRFKTDYFSKINMYYINGVETNRNKKQPDKKTQTSYKTSKTQDQDAIARFLIHTYSKDYTSGLLINE